MKTHQMRRSIGCFITALILVLCQGVQAQENGPAEVSSPEKPPELMLVRSLMCEGIRDFEPENETIVFAATLSQAVCFTAFDLVPGKTEIYHHWFKRDQPDAKFKLTLKPPKWSTFSQIRLAPSDVGPWRVDITDASGTIFQTLRFSVTE